jgi:hypothetical protein
MLLSTALLTTLLGENSSYGLSSGKMHSDGCHVSPNAFLEILHSELPSAFIKALCIFPCDTTNNSDTRVAYCVLHFTHRFTACHTTNTTVHITCHLTSTLSTVFYLEYKILKLTDSTVQSPTWEVDKFSAFYGTRKFITAFTIARHNSLSWTSEPCSCSLSHMFKIYFIVFLPSMFRLPKYSLSHKFVLYTPRLVSYVLHAPSISLLWGRFKWKP